MIDAHEPETQPQPLDPSQLEPLARYAGELNNRLTREHGANHSRQHIADTYVLLTRLQRFAEHGAGRFADADVRFLAEIGDDLARQVAALLDKPDVPPADRDAAQFRAELGAGVLWIRDWLQAHVRSDRTVPAADAGR